ncbi:MAG: hypothetical protein J3Q66DRAFT_330185 [Benniella sp.]|nr:MAG: hypothetical protein J3Q66DRAFT_330185 [Benniella sp.]
MAGFRLTPNTFRRTLSFRLGSFLLALVLFLDLITTFNSHTSSSSLLVMGAPTTSSSSSHQHITKAAKAKAIKIKKRQARNPFLIHSLESTGLDSNHLDLVQALGVSLKGKKRGVAPSTVAAAAAASGTNTRKAKSHKKKQTQPILQQ